MAYELVCNEDNFLGLETFYVGDINWFNKSGTRPTGAYWHTQQGTGLNAQIIYDYLINNGYGIPAYQFTEENALDAWNGNEEKLNDFENNRYWLIGSFSEGFGVSFSIDSNSKIQVVGFYINSAGSAFSSYFGIINASAGSVSSGSSDNMFYFVDYLYENGLINNTQGLPVQSGRYEVTVREDLEREWYYYNNIDMVVINDSDTAWDTPQLVRTAPFYYPYGGTMARSDWHDIAKLSPYSTRPDPFKNSGGSTKPDGGNGNTRVSVDIPMPTAPPDMLLNSGIVKIYKPTSEQISDFIDFIYSQPTSIADNFKKIWADPIQSIISLGIVPFDVSAKDTTEIVKFCGISTNVAMYPVSTQFPEWEFGTLTLPEETNSFLDYASYTKVKINLPFIGICDLNVDDVMDATLTLKYIFDIATGDCVAHILCTKQNTAYGIDYNSPLYEFNGNMLAQAPLSANNWQGLYSGALHVASSLFQGMGSGNVAGTAISSTVDFLTSNKVDVKRSGSIQGNGSHLGNYIPYLIVECPIVSTTTEMFTHQGYPFNRLYKVKTLANYRQPETNKLGAGFTVFQKDSMYINIPKATDEEKEMIKNILESGVIF